MIDREKFRPAFEAWIKSRHPRASFERGTFNADNYLVEGLNRDFDVWCAALEFVTSEAAIERARRDIPRHGFYFTPKAIREAILAAIALPTDDRE